MNNLTHASLIVRTAFLDALLWCHRRLNENYAAFHWFIGSHIYCEGSKLDNIVHCVFQSNVFSFCIFWHFAGNFPDLYPFCRYLAIEMCHLWRSQFFWTDPMTPFWYFGRFLTTGDRFLFPLLLFSNPLGTPARWSVISVEISKLVLCRPVCYVMTLKGFMLC